MLEMILKIAGMIVTATSTIVNAIDLADRIRHQKSNRSDQLGIDISLGHRISYKKVYVDRKSAGKQKFPDESR